jgi:hypothetical protein
MRDVICPLCLILVLLLGILSGCGNESTSPGNGPPVISSLVAIPDTILAGHATMLWCNAADPQGDDLTYEWTAPSGTISGTGPIVTWSGPIPEGSYTISVEVSDPKGETAADSVEVETVSTSGTLLVATDNGLTAVHTDGSHFLLRADMRYDVEVLEQRIFARKSTAALDTIFELDHNGSTVRAIAISEAVPYPYSLVALPEGGFATLDNENDRIDFLDSDGNFLRTVIMPDPSPEELQCMRGVVVGDRLIVSETGGKNVVSVDLTTYAASILRDLSALPVPWLSDIDYWNKYYWLCGPAATWRFTPTGDVYDLCTFSVSNIISIAVVDAVGYFALNCSPSRLYMVQLPISPCTPELLASDLGRPNDMEYIPVLLMPGAKDKEIGRAY